MPASTKTPHKDYSGTPLVRKLGIVSAKCALQSIALLQEPPGFRELLIDCPPEVRFTSRVTPNTQLAIAFVRTASEVDPAADLLAGQLPKGASVWICWPKARLKPGFNEHNVRGAGLERGLVDYKVCSIDEDWSALKFARRKA